MRFSDDEGQPLIHVSLTNRERDVLSWAARGKTVEETSDILSISVDTRPDTHRKCEKKIWCEQQITRRNEGDLHRRDRYSSG
jgi:FixJ family two-component response regulator